MHLREGEKILRVYHHHPTPFIFRVLKIISATLPFFLLAFWSQESVSTRTYITIHLVIFTIFALVITYISLLYWLDKLVVTNFRAVYVDWKFLTLRDESDIFLTQIEDIQTQEKGFLSHFWFFDYGKLKLATASAYIAVEFYDAPDPESIRKYIYSLKPQ